MMRPTTYLLALDAHAGTITRWRKLPGKWAPERMQHAVLEREHWPRMGTMEMWRVLETFRLEGRVL